MSSNAKRVSVVVGAIDRLSKPMKAMNNRIEKIRAPVDRVNRSLGKLGRDSGVKQFSRQLRSAAANAKKTARALGGIAKWGGGIAAAGGAALFGVAKGMADAGDAAAKTADRLGFGVEALQEYRFAAERSGVSAQTLDMAIQRFGRRSAEAAMGTGAAKDALKALNIEVKDSSGNMRNAEAIFTEALGQLGKVKDPLTRNALAMKLFDSEGVKLVQMTKDGAEGIAALRKEARVLGAVISEDAARQSEAFGDKLTNVTTAVTGLRNRLGEKLLPVLTSLMDRLAVIISNHGPAISRWAGQFAERLGSITDKDITGWMASVKSALEKAGSVVSWISENFGIMNTIMTTVGVIVGGTVIGALSSLAVAFKAVGLALMTTPIGWIVGGLAAVAAGAIAVYKNWDSIKASLKAFGEFVLKYSPFGLLLKGMNAVIAKFSDFQIIDKIKAKLENMLPDWARDLLGDDEPDATAAKAAPIPGGGKAEVGGAITLSVQDDRIRVQRVEEHGDVGFEIDAGMAMGA